MKNVAALWEAVLDVLFPPHCVACHAMGAWWCESCRLRLTYCSSNEDGAGSLDGFVSTGLYHDHALRSMITALKYRGATRLLPLVAQHVCDWRASRMCAWPWAGETDVVIQPVPAAPQHVISRGFDQACEIAVIVKTHILPWAHIGTLLLRADERRLPQARLASGPLRSVNVYGAFFGVPGIRYPECVVLVDDVYTTGSTMQEAARVLKSCGVRRVYGFVLAIGK